MYLRVQPNFDPNYAEVFFPISIEAKSVRSLRRLPTAMTASFFSARRRHCRGQPTPHRQHLPHQPLLLIICDAGQATLPPFLSLPLLADPLPAQAKHTHTHACAHAATWTTSAPANWSPHGKASTRPKAPRRSPWASSPSFVRGVPGRKSAEVVRATPCWTAQTGQSPRQTYASAVTPNCRIGKLLRPPCGVEVSWRERLRNHASGRRRSPRPASGRGLPARPDSRRKWRHRCRRW